MAGEEEEVLSSDPICCKAVAKQASGVKAGGVSERRVTPVSVVPCRLHGEVAYRLEGAAVGAHSIPRRVGERYLLVRCRQVGCHPGPQKAGRKQSLSFGPISCKAVARHASGVKAGGVSERRVTPVSVVPCRLHGEIAYRLEGATAGAHPFPRYVGETYPMVQSCHMGGRGGCVSARCVRSTPSPVEMRGRDWRRNWGELSVGVYWLAGDRWRRQN